MSAERAARNVEHEDGGSETFRDDDRTAALKPKVCGQSSATGGLLCLTSYARRVNVSSAGFTLVEILVVVAIVAVLSTLTLPALRSLAGTSGVRGGVNTVMAALDQARAAAIENGADVYVGFPPEDFTDPGDPRTRFSSLIVFRGRTAAEPEGTIKPLSRWIRLPSGVSMQATNMSLSNLPTSPEALLPKLAGQKVDPVVIQYDRFGRVKTEVTKEADITIGESVTNITIGESIVTPDGLTWKGTNTQSLTAQRLTGRWLLINP